jgi:hypothetical protein
MADTEKFGRNYILRVQRPPPYADLVVQRPFTMEFDVTRRIFGSPNQSKITVYNLMPANRNSILKTSYNYSDIRLVQLDAGYGNSLRKILRGNIYQCNVQRVGTEFVSTIESFDGGNVYTNSYINIPFPAGTAYNDIINQIVDKVVSFDSNITIGLVDNFKSLGKTARAYPCSGNAIDRLKDIVGESGVYIDNMQIFVKKVNTVVPPKESQTVPIISSESGLIGTPVIESTLISFQMIFEPSLSVGQEINLQSGSELPLAYSGIKQITEVHHRGIISDAVCGDAITTVTAYAPGAPTLIGNPPPLPGSAP